MHCLPARSLAVASGPATSRVRWRKPLPIPVRRYAHQTYQHVVDLCRHNFTTGCSPQANLIFPACLGKCLVSNKSSLCIPCEEFKHSKSFAARARLPQIQMGADCLCRSRALATKAHRFRLVRLRLKLKKKMPITQAPDEHSDQELWRCWHQKCCAMALRSSLLPKST